MQNTLESFQKERGGEIKTNFDFSMYISSDRFLKKKILKRDRIKPLEETNFLEKKDPYNLVMPHFLCKIT